MGNIPQPRMFWEVTVSLFAGPLVKSLAFVNLPVPAKVRLPSAENVTLPLPVKMKGLSLWAGSALIETLADLVVLMELMLLDMACRISGLLNEQAEDLEGRRLKK